MIPCILGYSILSHRSLISVHFMGACVCMHAFSLCFSCYLHLDLSELKLLFSAPIPLLPPWSEKCYQAKVGHLVSLLSMIIIFFLPAVQSFANWYVVTIVQFYGCTWWEALWYTWLNVPWSRSPTVRFIIKQKIWQSIFMSFRKITIAEI